jgi:hypothetical protein
VRPAALEAPVSAVFTARLRLLANSASTPSPVFAPVAPPVLLAVRVSTPLARRQARPAILMPMYTSFGGLQALDYHSTTRALSRGVGREANPLARTIVNHRPAFIAVKAGSTAAMVLVAEQMWKKHPVRAVVFMAAANAGMAIVVAHNYSVK